MLWLITKGTSNQIISCNIHTTKDGTHQLWAERPNGKTMRLIESVDYDEVELVKGAIDHAISIGDPSLEL